MKLYKPILRRVTCNANLVRGDMNQGGDKLRGLEQ
jgi:hypothetical protein